MLRSFLAVLVPTLISASLSAQPLSNGKHSDSTDRFFQLESWLSTPNAQRTASGAPGPEYWQQRADYDIDVTLDDENQRINGVVRIDYHNQSPHSLSYLWIQLDQNHFQPDSDAVTTASAPSLAPKLSFQAMNSILARTVFEGGYKIESVTDANDAPIEHSIVKTMMRLDLDQPLAPGQSTKINIRYSFNIVDAKVIRARGGYEFFEKDENYIYEIAQWYPRVVAYTDYHRLATQAVSRTRRVHAGIGRLHRSHHRTGRHGRRCDRRVAESRSKYSSPNGSSGLPKPRQSKTPMFVITPEEAKENEPKRGKQTKTWIFDAKNVRDFAFAASRKFIWDAMGVNVDGNQVMAMSYYPNEAEPLWSQYSTEAIAHTLEVYGRYSFAYPYPVAISVNGPVYGMEYPMICFNGPRPEEDGTYTKATKYGLISVVIHEVGHNFFPMIVNSDERQWTWMDEGLNTFLQYLSEQEWEDRLSVAARRPGENRPLHAGRQPTPDHDRQRRDPAIRPQCLFQAGDGAEHPARNDPRS